MKIIKDKFSFKVKNIDELRKNTKSFISLVSIGNFWGQKFIKGKIERNDSGFKATMYYSYPSWTTPIGQ